MGLVRLSAVGDMIFSGVVAEVLYSDGLCSPFEFVAGVLTKSDIVFGNLEGPLIKEGKPLDSTKCCIKSDPLSVEALKSAGFKVVSLANNHIFDYGYEGFKETKRILSSAGICGFGAGRNIREANIPCVLEMDGVSIGFLGYAWDFIGAQYASRKHWGVAPLDEQLILESVATLRTEVDVVIVSVHWGYERERYPLPSQRKLALEIVNAGANLIIGHHPHVIQGIERHGKGIILYSLGNFIFPDIICPNLMTIIQKPENKRAIIFTCDLSRNGIEHYEVVPIEANYKFQPVPLDRAAEEQMGIELQELSRPFTHDYSQFWRKYRIRKDLPDLGNSHGHMRRVTCLLHRYSVALRKRLTKHLRKTRS